MNSQKDIIDRLILSPYKDLSDEELQERWLFQQPSGELVPLLALFFIGAIFSPILGDWKMSGYALVGFLITLTIYTICRYINRLKVKKMTREQIINGIKSAISNRDGFDSF